MGILVNKGTKLNTVWIENAVQFTHTSRKAQQAKLFPFRESPHSANLPQLLFLLWLCFYEITSQPTSHSLQLNSNQLMEIPEKVLKFKFHILFALVVCVLVSTLILVAPRFLTILAYFWPLFLSTALFLVAVLVFGKTSIPATEDNGDKPPGEGLLHFVAGQPDHHAVESFKSE